MKFSPIRAQNLTKSDLNLEGIGFFLFTESRYAVMIVMV